MGNTTLKSTRKESCHVKGISIDKIPTLHSHDTANPPSSKEITGITHSNQPQHSASTWSTPTQMALSTRGPKPLPGVASPALYPNYLTSFPSSLPCSTPGISRQPSPLKEMVRTDFLYFVREVPGPQHTRPYNDHIKLRREITRHLDRKCVMWLLLVKMRSS